MGGAATQILSRIRTVGPEFSTLICGAAPMNAYVEGGCHIFVLPAVLHISLTLCYISMAVLDDPGKAKRLLLCGRLTFSESRSRWLHSVQSVCGNSWIQPQGKFRHGI
jgi:hypothetical protein